MTVFVYQTFEVKQEKFKEAIENAKKIKIYRNDHYPHQVELLNPISGQDYTYALLATYEGLAEMELQNKKMFEDEEYLKLIGEFFLENVVQGSMHTQIFRAMDDLIADKEKEDDKEK
ncbi:hypothetical protein [Robertmurraya andreesenii]|uniref:Phage protein n=1 Tax=Anoxybacillus andreesenii TaxID=1325932 RepID=A0ABT9V2E5_9BACL|nr:hypothetical protein [Robertmurraya andreesenii]MDQ0155040.1 hypothetical protein [Robertmurraya andreesenii]